MKKHQISFRIKQICDKKTFSCKKGNANVEEPDLSIIMDDFLVDWLLILTLSFFYCEVCLIVNHHRHLS